jgi:hypothetical protein
VTALSSRALIACCLVGCAPTPALAPMVETDWPAESTSHHVFSTEPPSANRPCQVDPALVNVASSILRQAESTKPIPAAHELALLLREQGSPLTMPRLVLLRGKGELSEHVHIAPTSRCGIARGTDVLLVVAADELATLTPLRSAVAPGQYVRFEAQLAPGIARPTLFLMDPDGTVRTVPVRYSESRTVSAMVSVRARGRTELQLMGDLADGPRPILEAFLSTEQSAPHVSADQEPSTVGALRARIEGVRTHALAVDATLQKIAEAHARTMMRNKKLAHDAGDGLPDVRVGSSYATLVGENVAHAHSLAAANLGLSRSPSHRLNRMRKEWTHVGIGVANDEDGSVWVTELYAARSSQ